MSHIHIPDGILPVLWWSSGYFITLTVIFLILKKMQIEDVRQRIPFIGVMAAVMLVSMSIPLGFIPLHFSLAVLCGILLGPSLGFITVFIVNFVLALMGHGGITVVGLNSIIMGSEVLIGAYLFRLLLNTKLSLVSSVVISTVTALLVSIVLMVGVVGTTVGVIEVLPHNHDAHEHHAEVSTDDTHSRMEVGDSYCSETLEDIHFKEAVSNINFFSFTGWGALILILLIGIILEALITALIINGFMKIKPDLILD